MGPKCCGSIVFIDYPPTDSKIPTVLIRTWKLIFFQVESQLIFEYHLINFGETGYYRYRPVISRIIDIIVLINSLKITSAPGHDEVTPMLLKLCAKYILCPLTHIINIIFISGKFPKQFKTSIITPIYKAGDKNKISNYRPISLINNFGKIAEKCIKTRLINFFKNNKIMNEHQYGFQEGKGTSDV